MRPIFFVCSILFSIQIFSQSLSGKILTHDKIPADGASILLLGIPDTIFIAGEVADAQGEFKIEIPKAGKYFLEINYLGTPKFKSEILELSPTENRVLSTIELQQSSTELKEVVIAAKKPAIQVFADRTVLNVDGNINSTGLNGLELLRKSPGVQVDNNENLILKGKSSVQVFIDGKLSPLSSKDLAEYLKSLTSADIEAIELISNPSAKYEAQGNAGIINIKLKKNKNFGSNGNVSLNYNQGYTPKGNGSIRLNHRNKKINAFGSFSLDRGIWENGMAFVSTQGNKTFNQTTVSTSNNKSENYKAGLDYFINKNSTIGTGYTGGHRNSVWNNSSRSIIGTPGINNVDSFLIATNRVPKISTNHNVNVYYKYALPSGKEFSIDLDRGFFNSDATSFQPNEYRGQDENLLLRRVDFRNITNTDIDIYTAKVDYALPYKNWKFETGGKLAWITSGNGFQFFDVISSQDIKNSDLSNDFTYLENVNALYGNVNRTLGKKWTLQAGLRLENTQSDGDLSRTNGQKKGDDRVKRNYTDLFPSAALAFNKNDNHSFNLNYSRRIDRPDYQNLNPFEWKLDELSYEKGNPFLRPQYTNNIEFTHLFKQMISTSIGYSKTTDLMTQFIDTTETFKSFVTTKNIGSQDHYSFSIGSPTPFNKWWDGYINLNLYYDLYEGTFANRTNFSAGVVSFNGYAEQNFQLKKGWSVQVSGWFNGPSLWGAVNRTKSQGSLDIGFQKKILKGDGNIRWSMRDIFFTAPWRSSNNLTPGLNMNGRGYWESRLSTLSFTYKFGNKNVKVNERKSGSKSEQDRLKQESK
jgi:iron complex outermembrane recepter protein